MPKLLRFLMIPVALLAVMGMAQAQGPYNLTLTGASPGGLWSRIGGGVDAAIAAAYPGSTVTYQTSKGGLANIALVSRGSVPMGMATDGELAAAYNGQKPFRTPIKNIRVLFRVYSPAARFQATHLMLNKDFADRHGIRSFADIVRKKVPMRVAINRRGNMDSDVSRIIMEKMGASIKDIESWGGQVVYAASKEIVSLMLDRRIDLANFGIAYRHPRIREIAKGITPILLNVPKSVVTDVARTFGGETCVFKKGEYKFSNQDINSVCIGAVIIANQNMDDKLAYNITKAIVSKIEKFKTAHRLIKKNTTPGSIALPAIVPHHQGSARYLRERGLLK
ncbi:MAG: TAXI family TRAP transporter solute-binding subunit [bacterium]